ncbi:MAG: prepilin-type N-terminal cleavage/methylation domain-containing protein [Armatimonadetes bacterium]|nr:prepilin-type N-terminal cleavage/methylation domain-containing protein [Armatimonadota bacterium]MBM3947489.1 prepilin-type N-terminal cleavage/methylation domain-containing protein [SAR202 cluster bacterium]
MLTHARRGFTLIELLVVIAIIAILAAILFPVFAQARSKARQAQGLSNLRQMGTALRMYVDEYDGQMPQHAYGDTGRGRPGNYQWPHALQPYIKNWSVFVCPNASQLNGIARFNGIDFAAYQSRPDMPRDGRYIGYAINLNYHQHSSDPAVSWHPTGKHETMIEDVADTILITEHFGAPWQIVWASNGPPVGGPYLPTNADWMRQPDPMTGVRIARSSDGVDLLFCDGHAKWMAPDSAFARRPSSRGTVAYRYTRFQD